MRLNLRVISPLLICALCAAPVGAQDLTGTLKKIKDTGIVKIGNRDASIPFSYYNDKQQPIGYGIDICLKVVDAIKAELKMPNLRVDFVPVTSQTRIPILAGGNIDLECGSTTNTVERQKQVAFAPTYFFTGTRLLVKTTSGIRNYDDLKGKVVVVTAGTTNEQAIKTYSDVKNLGIKFLQARDHAESFLAVEIGRAMAFPMDDILLYGLRARARKPADFEIVGELLTDEPYAIMMRKDDPAFKKAVDSAVIALYRSGEINKIYGKWFQSPISPSDINLNLPMSDALKELIKNPNDRGVAACGRIEC
jgi:glutamate/aspartate transport system substrate-binding protein